MNIFIETIVSPWKRVPLLLKLPTALVAAFCSLKLSGWVDDHGHPHISLVLMFLAMYQLFWGVGLIPLFIGFRKLNRKLFWGNEKPTLRRWYWRHYWLGTFDDPDED
ncbi:hypothetical protein [Paraburkholderia domus]|uniref:hypothetical protein n=1 Tax=Paraburkholderia domus TaxID=2793075 RepID=UPI0019113A2C|nr:hypothetical protein [Paraburkholderia domus]MBK5065775.1 hypothetical protein [Burkholderia sp. R-70199]CAE6962967.1 hypothetical protein R70199_07462 [Paraburkholderia domus]